jgi:hypothetical protein
MISPTALNAKRICFCFLVRAFVKRYPSWPERMVIFDNPKLRSSVLCVAGQNGGAKTSGKTITPSPALSFFENFRYCGRIHSWLTLAGHKDYWLIYAEGHRSFINFRKPSLSFGEIMTAPFLCRISSLSMDDAGALKRLREGLMDVTSERATVHLTGPPRIISFSSRTLYPVPKNTQQINMLIPVFMNTITEEEEPSAENASSKIPEIIIAVSHQSYLDRKYMS